MSAPDFFVKKNQEKKEKKMNIVNLIVGFLKVLPFVLWDTLVGLFKKNKVSAFNRYARIDIIVGKTGAGKSISAVWHANRLSRAFGIPVYSNMTVEGWLPLSADVILSANSEPRIIVIDEIQNVFPARQRGSSVSDDLRTRLTQVRKYGGTYLICLTQDYSLIDTSFRKLSHFVHDVSTLFSRLTIIRTFRQLEFENFSTVGGIDTKNNNSVSRRSLHFVQTNKLRRLYDYKAFVPDDWYKDTSK